MDEILEAIRNGAHAEAAAAIAAYTSDINVNCIMWCGGILPYAVIFDSVLAIEALAARGDVDPDVCREWGDDPVLRAIKSPDTLRAILRYFPDITVNACVVRGFTPLSHSAFNGYMESVQLLLDAGADPTLGAPQKNARQNGHEAVAVRIEQHVAWVNGLRRFWTHASVDASVKG